VTRLGAPAQCGGCGAKAAPAVLAEAVANTAPTIAGSVDVLVGLDRPDDAAVHIVPAGRAVVTTADMFPPPVDDPAAFGAICAANAVSDVYAMGGCVHTALILAAFPRSADPLHVGAALRAARDVVEDCGGVIVGGHTVHAPTPLLGLSVTGSVDPNSIWRTTGAHPGDVLVLSKPLGTGMALASGEPEAISEAVAVMRTTNRSAADELRQVTVHAVTDVTGYGLLGHLLGMLGAAQGATLTLRAVPVLGGVARGFFAHSGAHSTNHAFVADRVEGSWRSEYDVLVDPQTSGGLLAAVPPEAVTALPGFTAIGEVTESQRIRVEGLR
jgi:selenide,water dikinase